MYVQTPNLFSIELSTATTVTEIKNLPKEIGDRVVLTTRNKKKQEEKVKQFNKREFGPYRFNIVKSHSNKENIHQTFSK